MIWEMIGSWLLHGMVTSVVGLLGLISGGSSWAIACALGYFFREIRQNETYGTFGFQQWLDRIMDAAVPLGVAMGFAILMQ